MPTVGIGAGTACKEEGRAGDRVCALLPGGGYAERVSVPAGLAMRIPENLPFEDAAAIPEVFLTAYQNLFNVARLAPGEAVLIHAGGSGVGTAAVQLVREAGGGSPLTGGGRHRDDGRGRRGSVQPADADVEAAADHRCRPAPHGHRAEDPAHPAVRRLRPPPLRGRPAGSHRRFGLRLAGSGARPRADGVERQYREDRPAGDGERVNLLRGAGYRFLNVPRGGGGDFFPGCFAPRFHAGFGWRGPFRSASRAACKAFSFSISFLRAASLIDCLMIFRFERSAGVSNRFARC